MTAEPRTGQPVAQPRQVLDGMGWLYDSEVLDDARSQALPYKGDPTAQEKAWAARVDSAIAGMDVVDPAGLDEWMASHAKADQPHLAEAALVAVWETHIRDLFADTADDASENDGRTVCCQPIDDHTDANSDFHVLDEGDGLP